MRRSTRLEEEAVETDEEPEVAAADVERVSEAGDEERGAPVDDDTLAVALEALKKEPTDRGSLGVVKRAYRQRGDLEALLEQAERSVKYLRRKPGEFKEMREVALLLWKERADLERADYYYKRLRREDPSDEAMLAFYEEFFEQRGEWRKLHAHLGQALSGAARGGAPRRSDAPDGLDR